MSFSSLRVVHRSSSSRALFSIPASLFGKVHTQKHLDQRAFICAI